MTGFLVHLKPKPNIAQHWQKEMEELKLGINIKLFEGGQIKPTLAIPQAI